MHSSLKSNDVTRSGANPQNGVRFAQPPPVSTNAWLDGLLPAALDRTGIAGATVAVVGDGRIITTRGYGYADTGDGGDGAVPVDPDRHLRGSGTPGGPWPRSAHGTGCRPWCGRTRTG